MTLTPLLIVGWALAVAAVIVIIAAAAGVAIVIVRSAREYPMGAARDPQHRP